MNESFTRVIDQFTAIQAMMGNVQAVASQVGDLKRLFGNVKARGGWGEAQVRALLEDILPVGTWDSNVRLREDSLDVVEFTVTMPSQGSQKAVMAVDAKFPTEDYDRLLQAADNADAEGEKAARAALERRIRDEAKKIAAKYIVPPRTVEFAVMYLPNDGLYAEVARIPGLTDEIGRLHRVFVLGPALLPAMLRTIQLGHVPLALSENAEGVRDLLSATKAEMQKMDVVLGTLSKQAGSVVKTIGSAQVRTRAISRKLKGLEVMAAPAAEALLELTAEDSLEEDEA
jgi:DNA recombination protein RmuC